MTMRRVLACPLDMRACVIRASEETENIAVVTTHANCVLLPNYNLIFSSVLKMSQTRSTQPSHPFVGRCNKYLSTGSDALQLGSKCR